MKSDPYFDHFVIPFALGVYRLCLCKCTSGMHGQSLAGGASTYVGPPANLKNVQSGEEKQNLANHLDERIAQG